MPLTNFQRDILVLLAHRRNPDSYVAGGLPVNEAAARFSRDIDVFHTREASVSAAARADAAVLESSGCTVNWIRQEPLMYSAAISRGNERTRIEWVVDSDYRFFPVVPDQVFGYVLHAVDLASNKVMAAAGRREVRDLVDLVTIHKSILPLGAVIWAAVDKSPGFTPEGLIAEIRRNSNYSKEEWATILSAEPVDPGATVAELRKALDEAEAFVARMPTDLAGLVFLDGGKVVQPDPDRLDKYVTHAGRRLGHWPESAEITAAMIERYVRKPASDA